jgi:putative aldouronate transport system permease protein
MKHKNSVGEIIFDIINNAIMVLVIIITAYPMLHVLFASLSNPDLIIAHKGLLIKPIGFTFEAYKAVFSYNMIIVSFRNTIFIVVVGVVINLVITSFGAYFLSRKGVIMRNTIMKFIVFTMFFSGGLVPFYLTVNGLGLRNSLLSVIIPFAVNTFNLIIMRTAFASIPDSLIEAAEIEGANDFLILFQIVLPVSKATISVIALYYMVQHWNSWFYATVFIDVKELLPMQVILREILIQNSTETMQKSGDSDNMYEVIKYSVIVVATVPILFVYPFMQKHFTKGVMIGSVKG